MKFLRGKKIKVLQGEPAQSPDMNIFEHIWERMKEEAWRTKPKYLEELWDACKVAFHAIPDNKLYDSLPNRMATVLQAKGTHTRYELLNFYSMMKYSTDFSFVILFTFWER